MVDEFEVNVDDELGVEIVGYIMKVRSECVQGQFDEVNILKMWFLSKGIKKVDVMFKKIEVDDQDIDWEFDDLGDDDEDGGVDVEMGDVLLLEWKEKFQFEVDEDGFIKVMRKRQCR